jgi:phage terminase large subunit GpA-like protein
MQVDPLPATAAVDNEPLDVVSAVAVLRLARAEGLRPDPPVTVSEWSDAHRRLPAKSSAEPGPWRTDRTPYLREVMDCLSATSDVEEVVFMKGAQVGGTEAIINALGYVIDHAPGPTMFVQPTVELAKRFSRQRVDPLVTDTPRLADKVAASKSRDSGNTMLSKEFPGGQLIITGANSAVGLRSMPARNVFLDEIDGYPLDVDEEGSPIELVEARQRTFARRKRAKVSTPTIAGRSAIEEAYEDTDRRRFYVPCPDCGHMQPLEFSQLQWTKYGRPPEQAVYECRACYYPIEHHRKTWMLERGEWVAERPERVGKVRGYHLSALYSPAGWISWGDIASKFVKVQKNPDKLRVFVNTILGQTWKEVGDAPDWERLMERRSTYAIGTVPAGALFLTAGVDVQKDRLVYEVVGWGRGKRSWSIDAGELPGDTADLQRGPWVQLADLLERQYQHASGLSMPIAVMAVDSGFNTQTVYNWTRTYPASRVLAVKGVDAATVLVGAPTKVDLKANGRRLRRSLLLWPVCGGIAKSELFGWLRLEPLEDGTTPDGACEFPEYGEEFFKQLTAEQLVSRRSRRGYIRMEWEVIPGRQNHALDARVYARAAAQVAGLDRFTDTDWTKREALFPVTTTAPDQTPDTVTTTPADAPAPSTTPTRPTTPARSTSWLGRGRGSWLKRNR